MEHLRNFVRWTDGLNYPARVLGATLVVATATLIHWLLDSYMAGHVYTIFLVAVNICSIVFNRKTGIYALVLSCIALDFFFIEPRFNIVIGRGQLIAFLVFICASLVLIVVGEALRMLANALNHADDAKAILLRELRHRSKNYLQIVSAAVRVAASDATQDETKAILATVAQRIESIGHIAAALDAPDERGLFDARQFFEGLVKSVGASLVGSRPIVIDCRADAIPIERKTAEVLGIAANELITNAVKHAFPGNRRGKVAVDFAGQPEGGLRLTISDDGIGGLEHAASGTGLDLVSALVKMQGGTVAFQDANQGSRVAIRL